MLVEKSKCVRINSLVSSELKSMLIIADWDPRRINASDWACCLMDVSSRVNHQANKERTLSCVYVIQHLFTMFPLCHPTLRIPSVMIKCPDHCQNRPTIQNIAQKRISNKVDAVCTENIPTLEQCFWIVQCLRDDRKALVVFLRMLPVWRVLDISAGLIWREARCTCGVCVTICAKFSSLFPHTHLVLLGPLHTEWCADKTLESRISVMKRAHLFYGACFIVWVLVEALHNSIGTTGIKLQRCFSTWATIFIESSNGFTVMVGCHWTFKKSKEWRVFCMNDTSSICKT